MDNQKPELPQSVTSRILKKRTADRLAKRPNVNMDWMRSPRDVTPPQSQEFLLESVGYRMALQEMRKRYYRKIEKNGSL